MQPADTMNLAAIRTQIDHVRRTLLTLPVFVRGTGVPVDDPAFGEDTSQLERIKQTLEICLRELKNNRHLLDVQRQALSNLPREARYPRASSINQQQKDADDLLRTAADVQKQIEDLIRDSGLISKGELAKGLSEFISKFYAESPHPGIAAPGALPIYTSLPPGHFNTTPEAATVAIFVALDVLTRLLKRRESKKA
jgi:hypothetical protein